jgi:membrane fusion protein (multidrug efflux system)
MDESCESAPRLLASGIDTMSSREQSNRSIAMNPMAESSTPHENLVDERAREYDGASIDDRLMEQAGAGKPILRRLVKTLMLVLALLGGGVFVLHKVRADIPALNTSELYASLDSISARAEQLKTRIVGHKEEESVHHEHHKIVVTSPMAKDVTITQDYVCQIHSQRHINICALENGYLKAIPIKEGQAVKTGQLMFEIVPILYKARLDAELAERDLAQMELNNTRRLAAKQGVSQNEVKLYEAKLARAQAKADLALAELNFTTVKAPFDGIIDRLHEQQGSLVKEGDMLTTLSDNSVMWVYFNVPEIRYLEYMAEVGQHKESPDIELVLANGTTFPHTGRFDPIRRQIGAIEANFNNETGNISFRADFPNPERLLRHGQTGTVLIKRLVKDAIIIPQRAIFENLAKRYVYVVDKDDVVHQREIEIAHELEDIYVIGMGLDVRDRIVLEGIRQVRDGDKVEYESLDPVKALGTLKNHAE